MTYNAVLAVKNRVLAVRIRQRGNAALDRLRPLGPAEAAGS